MSNTSINCPKCGGTIKGDSLYCSYCGAALMDVRDILKKQAELNIKRQENDEDIRHQKAKTDQYLRIEETKNSADKARYTFATVFMIIGIGAILFMCLIATR